MKPAMYIFINKGLGMSPGKIAAQAGHAACEALLMSHPATSSHTQYGNTTSYSLTQQNDLWNAWRTGLHYAKYVMEARDSEHLLYIDRYLRDRGFRTVLIVDEGHTEIEPIQPTALGVALVDKDDPHTDATFSSFNLYQEDPPQVLVFEGNPTPAELAIARHIFLTKGYDAVEEYVAAVNEQDKRRWWRFGT
jgi:peptidyl-tRNA hydrolase